MQKNSTRSRRARPTAAVMAALTGAVLLASCGGGSHPPPAGGPSLEQVDAFVQCMRSHGMPSFYLSRPNSANPDPNEIPIGFLPYGVVYGVDVSSPQYQSANNACQRLLPGGGAPSGVTSALLRRMDRQAACMRSHGFPDYPDPDVQHGQLIPRPLPTDIDISSPQFMAAVKTCGNAAP